MNLPEPRLLLVTDRRQARRPLDDIFTAVLAAGCRWISLREQHLPADEQIRLARALNPLMHPYGAVLTVHGEAALAVAAGSDGVHLPSHSDAGAARILLGPKKLVGISIHSLAEAASLDPGIVDYAVAGPVFETVSKPGYGPELGVNGIAEIARAARVPVLAIGGVTAARVEEITAAGAAGVAVMGGIMRATDPAEEVGALIAALRRRGTGLTRTTDQRAR
jgi:thiamine-phosphate pyrophosphorylase